MALHLLNDKDNDHVTVHEISGFVADDVHGALREIYAVSKGTKAKQYMYSLSLNPPDDKHVSVEEFEHVIERAEKRLKLDNQPRVVVFHEKHGRRHAHCIWSRIDIEQMKAVNMSYDRDKLHNLSKQIFIEKNWQMPLGMQDRSKRNPLNYSFESYQEAKRLGQDAQNIAQTLQECWSISDDRKSFEIALEESGYYLASGDKHYMVVNSKGNTHSLPRKLNKKDHELESRLGDKANIPSIVKVQRALDKIREGQHDQFLRQLATEHEKALAPLNHQKEKLVRIQRQERQNLTMQLEQRWQAEERRRSQRVRHGFKGIWDKITGAYLKIRKQNEQETLKFFERDRKQLEVLTQAHLVLRSALQQEINTLHAEQDKEYQDLVQELGSIRREAYSKHAITDIFVEEMQTERSKKRDKILDEHYKVFKAKYKRYQAHIDKKTKESRVRWKIDNHIKARDQAWGRYEKIDTPDNRRRVPSEIDKARDRLRNMEKRLNERLWRHKDDIVHLNRNRKLRYQDQELHKHGFGKGGQFEFAGQDIEEALQRRHDKSDEMLEEMMRQAMIDFDEMGDMTLEEYREYQQAVERVKQTQTIDPEAGFEVDTGPPDERKLER